MKPQLYSIIILLLARINYVQNTERPNNNQDDANVITTNNNNNTAVAQSPADNVTSVTQAPNDHKTSAPETTDDNVTSVTKASKGNATSVTTKPSKGNTTSVTIKANKGNTTSVTSRETIVSEIPADKITVLPKVPNSNATPAPSLAPKMSPVSTTKGFTRTTGSASVSIEKQTSNPTMAGNTTLRINKVPNTVRKTTRPASTKPTTDKDTGNRTSTFPVPSLFAIVLLVVSLLCF